MMDQREEYYDDDTDRVAYYLIDIHLPLIADDVNMLLGVVDRIRPHIPCSGKTVSVAQTIDHYEAICKIINEVEK